MGLCSLRSAFTCIVTTISGGRGVAGEMQDLRDTISGSPKERELIQAE